MDNKGIVWGTSGFEGLEISMPSLNRRTSLRVNGSAFGIIWENEFNNLGDLFIFENESYKLVRCKKLFNPLNNFLQFPFLTLPLIADIKQI